MYIDLNAKNNICGLFLFDPKKDPEPVHREDRRARVRLDIEKFAVCPAAP